MIECTIKTCVGCRMCEVACSSYHFHAVPPALARIRVSKLEEVGLDMAVACQGCLEKPCLECPSGALSIGGRGEVALDAGLCNACGICADACPIGAVGFHEGRPLFCDLCGGAAVCVDVCPTGALCDRQDHEEISLQAFLLSEGNPSEKRAQYVLARGLPVRAGWQNGARVDS